MDLKKHAVHIEDEWAAGYHLSSNGQRTKLSELPTQYLKNIINKYGTANDASAVKAELAKREQEN